MDVKNINLHGVRIEILWNVEMEISLILTTTIDRDTTDMLTIYLKIIYLLFKTLQLMMENRVSQICKQNKNNNSLAIMNFNQNFGTILVNNWIDYLSLSNLFSSNFMAINVSKVYIKKSLYISDCNFLSIPNKREQDCLIDRDFRDPKE